LKLILLSIFLREWTKYGAKRHGGNLISTSINDILFIKYSELFFFDFDMSEGGFL